MSQDLWELDAVGQAALVKSGEVSALDLVDAAIARIEKLEPVVHAVASVDFDAAREKARSRPSGPLGGVPFLIKDVLAYPGHKFTLGSRLFRDYIAPAGSPYTDQLDAAGLVTLGKTTTSEFGLLGSTETLLAGITRNPWDLTKSALGSSGGAAAAVASGMVPMAHASDGGGSIRIPASACGLFGFKPGHRRCVTTGQVDTFELVIDHCVSRTVRDSALLLSLTEDPDAHPRVGYVDRPLDRKLRIGVYSTTLLGRAPDPEVMRALSQTMRLCADLGHEVVEAPPPPVDGVLLSEAFFDSAGAAMHEIVRSMESMLGRSIGEDDLELFTLALIHHSRSLPEGAEARAKATVAHASARMLSYMESYDVLLCPTLPVAPYDLGTLAPHLDRELLIRRTEVLAGYTPIYSMAGVPAMSVPLGSSESGLPLGSHFAAPLGQEATLLGLAYQLEAAAPWRHRWPAVTIAARERASAAVLG
ncbi:amidase family protein [Polyangium sp. 15x6]|uniref:amidase n=1 Tax=Polyangium sp. 15x6 TaxID=3042687 RepID=UPI00249A61BD|nr:amidase family protein [Polyangium sp. 15x6]MDI3289869.1 amidase family protein [Polyangium sp. 15x6]